MSACFLDRELFTGNFFFSHSTPHTVSRMVLLESKSGKMAFLPSPPAAACGVWDWILTPQGHRLSCHSSSLPAPAGVGLWCPTHTPLSADWLLGLRAFLLFPHSPSPHSVHAGADGPCPSFKARATLHLPWETKSQLHDMIFLLLSLFCLRPRPDTLCLPCSPTSIYPWDLDFFIFLILFVSVVASGTCNLGHTRDLPIAWYQGRLWLCMAVLCGTQTFILKALWASSLAPIGSGLEFSTSVSRGLPG